MKYCRLFITLLFLVIWSFPEISAAEFSTAGFYRLSGSQRSVSSMNPAWRFHKGDAAGASDPAFNDSSWGVVSLPHGLEELPPEASGCVNYQGPAWYRKHFTPADSLRGKKVFLHFEGIMGKSRVYVNGKQVTEHFGGYLPVIADLTGLLRFGEDNVIAVMTDNSDDPSYPPGKPQDMLDFTYMGGIYRDCWLVSHGDVYVTDPNYEDIPAGGGLLVTYEDVSDRSARVKLLTHIRNERPGGFSGRLNYELIDPDGRTVATHSRALKLSAGKDRAITDILTVDAPQLWTPDDPQLYRLKVSITDSQGRETDSFMKRLGIRSVEFKGEQGFYLNGKPYGEPLIGANRHQDFAVVGHAVPNATHWRDAKKLRDAGFKVIRNAHCPQDPAFMDACDELGLFVIVNTPGWQFWNDDPKFAQRVYSDIRNMIRRDRNHPSVWMWEPILNETWYPADFAGRTVEIVGEEFPGGRALVACDESARGSEHFTIRFRHPANADPGEQRGETDPEVSYFTREWGDNVDDWNSHNSPSRVSRGWGEHAMLVQAQHYASPDYPYSCLETLHRTTPQHMGGCLWHSFDHQRGYHPDPFYGGVMDAFRQPKYSWTMFASQRPAEKLDRPFATGPMVYIAHEMTPFSPKDVTVYSNCDEVRLTYNKGGKTLTYTKPAAREGMPSPIITFKDVYDFMIDKNMSMKEGKQKEVFLLAEGLMDGKVVATHKVRPARRPSQLLLWADNENTELKADGSDFVTVVAAIADKNGNIKRLNNYYVKFHIEGEGRILGGANVLANPAPVKWGTAPVLVQSTLKPGKIKITASVLFEGSQMPVAAELELESKPAAYPLIYSKEEAALIPMESDSQSFPITAKSKEELEKEKAVREQNERKLKEVEQQQADFGEKK